MSIQELEEVLAHTEANAFTWGELLDSRFTRTPGEDERSRGLVSSISQSKNSSLKISGGEQIENLLNCMVGLVIGSLDCAFR